MKGTPGPLVAHMALPVTTLARLAKFTKLDSSIFAVTDHDTDIVYGGTTYKSLLGVNMSSIEYTEQLNVDNLEVRGFLTALGVQEADIDAGRWDFCQVRIMRVNWADLSMGDEKLKRGWIGQISQGRDTFVAEIRGLTVMLQQAIGEVYSSSCKADLFDARCTVVPTFGVWQFTGIAVTTVVAAQRQWTSSALTQAAGFFTAGKVTWTSGQNNTLSKEIKIHAASGNILLQEPMPYPIAVTDTYTIFAGCRKRYVEDCGTKFSNQAFHRGFPFLPGQDATLRGY